MNLLCYISRSARLAERPPPSGEVTARGIGFWLEVGGHVMS
jgi:hypothetical protein